jgi:hypothetical protein
VMSLFRPPVMQEPSPCLHPNMISIWDLARVAICLGKSLLVELASQAFSLTKRAPRQAFDVLIDSRSEVSPNSASFDYCPVEQSLPAFVIVRERFQDPA